MPFVPEDTKETFSWLQLLGFLVLILGGLIYNEILVLPFWGFATNTKAAIKKREEQDKIDNRKNNKASYQRYKEQDKRQYDIIDLKERPFNEHKDIIKTGGISDWQKIINDAGKNNTFGKKKIYKDPYDYSEAGSSYDAYKKSRKKLMNKLPKIESDKLFNQLKKNKKG